MEDGSAGNRTRPRATAGTVLAVLSSSPVTFCSPLNHLFDREDSHSIDDDDIDIHLRPHKSLVDPEEFSLNGT
jgi:hypothetical protein